MKRLAPSEMIRNEIEAALQQGIPEGDLLSWLVQKSIQRVLQEALEQEVSDHLGRERYARGERERPGYRNGYEEKTLKTAEGPIPLRCPQVRGSDETYHSRLLEEGSVVTERLREIVLEGYVRGLSTRDLEAVFTARDGSSMITRQAVSDLAESLNEEYSVFVSRDLSEFDVVYLFVDGVYEQMRYSAGKREAILCAWAILASGEKILLHLGLGNKESKDAWSTFFREMIQRGLREPLLVVTDGAAGLISAVEECFPHSKRQRCLFHKLQNISNKLPESAHREIMAKVRNVFDQISPKMALLAAQNLVDQYASQYPSAIRCLQDDLEACLAYLEFPLGHYKAIRTTNLIERAFEEYRRRSKVIPRHFGEKSCLKLIYGVLIRVSERWRRVKMSEYDLTLLRNLRDLYGAPDNEELISRRIAS